MNIRPTRQLNRHVRDLSYYVHRTAELERALDDLGVATREREAQHADDIERAESIKHCELCRMNLDAIEKQIRCTLVKPLPSSKLTAPRARYLVLAALAVRPRSWSELGVLTGMSETVLADVISWLVDEGKVSVVDAESRTYERREAA